MNPQSLKNFYTWGVKLLIFIIPFLSLYIASSMYFPYITGRNFAFRILVEIALVLWLGLILLDKQYRPKPSIILWSVAAFTIIVGLATIFSVNPYYSFWSRFERMEGYIMILHLAAYFLITTTVLRTKKDWSVLFNIFIIAGLLVGLYALWQRLGFTRAIQGGRARVDGTIGNPTYLAGYLLFILALGLVFFYRAKKIWVKYCYGIASAFTLLIIYFTASRGPILALLAAVFLWLVLYNILVKPRKKAAVAALIAMIALPILFFALRNTSLVQTKEPTALSRLASISLTEKTTKSRFLIWNMAWQGFKERPIFGWGQENYIDVFSKYYNPKLFDQEPWFDRAHNIIFDWLVNAGVLGLLSYLSLFAAAFAVLWTLYKRGALAFSEASLFFAALIAYVFQNLLVFDTSSTYILFFSFLAYINSMDNLNGTTTAPVQENAKNINRRKNISVAAALTALILMLPVIYFANVKPIKTAQALIDVLQLVNDRASPDEVLGKFKKALSYNTFGDLETREQLARLAIQLMEAASIPPEVKISFVKFAVEELEKYIARHPRDLKTTLLLGTLYHKAASFDGIYVEKARILAEVAVSLSPTRQTSYFLLADNYLLRGDFNNALVALAKVVELEPTFMEGQFNLARIAIFAQREDVAQMVINDVKRLSPDDASILAKIGDVYVQIKHFERAMEVYEDVVKISPKTARYHINLSEIYLNRGRKADAEREAKIAEGLK